jgi:hypothetical protein
MKHGEYEISLLNIRAYMDFGFLPHNLRVALFEAVIREFQRPTDAMSIDEDLLKWLFE